MVYGERYPTRIIKGPTAAGWHMQAQAFTGNKWEWLVYFRGSVEVGEQEHEWTGPVTKETAQEAVTRLSKRYRINNLWKTWEVKNH